MLGRRESLAEKKRNFAAGNILGVKDRAEDPRLLAASLRRI